MIYQPGDFVLYETKGFLPRLIRFGQWLRYRGPRKPYSRWNHAALIVDASGTIIQAQANGVRYGTLGTGRVVNLQGISPEDRLEIVDYAKQKVNATRYGFVAFVSIAVNLITGFRLRVSYDRTLICSALVAGALERAGVVWPIDSEFVTPADLAAKYDVR